MQNVKNIIVYTEESYSKRSNKLCLDKLPERIKNIKKQIMITLLKTLLTIHYVNSLFNALKLLIQTSAAYLYDKLDKR